MTDNPNKRGKQDRELIASKQPYEVRYFASKWGLSASVARSIIKEHGPSRNACNKAALQRLRDIQAYDRNPSAEWPANVEPSELQKLRVADAADARETNGQTIRS